MEFQGERTDGIIKTLPSDKGIRLMRLTDNEHLSTIAVGPAQQMQALQEILTPNQDLHCKGCRRNAGIDLLSLTMSDCSEQTAILSPIASLSQDREKTCSLSISPGLFSSSAVDKLSCLFSWSMPMTAHLIRCPVTKISCAMHWPMRVPSGQGL